MIKFRIAEDTRKLIGKRVEVTQISKRFSKQFSRNDG